MITPRTEAGRALHDYLSHINQKQLGLILAIEAEAAAEAAPLDVERLMIAWSTVLRVPVTLTYEQAEDIAREYAALRSPDTETKYKGWSRGEIRQDLDLTLPDTETAEPGTFGRSDIYELLVENLPDTETAGEAG